MILELNEIKKSFKIGGGQEFVALQGVNLSFDKGEFVSIVGPSGSGKSTLLNIIAGLDRPTDGELIIGEKSSKKFKKKDWDLYRKNNIGFIFQNFNLIEHLTAIENVEIVMNLIGMSYNKRRKRAKELLEKVGLEKHLNHKPSELSGGQKQRVAIARALANDPDIILADEPTGALDKHTGTQIMELIKSIAKDKLIIMVTHNQALADEYSSRIIKVRDGKIESDEVLKKENINHEKSILTKKDSAMSFFEAFKLSLRNMAKKKGRVLITTIAGCIGIIGFTLITGLGNGANIYIDKQLNKFGTANVLVLSKNINVKDANGNNQMSVSTNIEDYKKILEDEYIKENTSNVRRYINMTSDEKKAIGVSLSNVVKNDNQNSIGHTNFQIFGLADSNHIDFLTENVTGSIPRQNEYEVLVNQATARDFLKDLDIDSKDIEQVIGKKITIVYTIPQEGIKVEKEFTISGIVNELDIGIASLYYNYDDVKTWLEETKLQTTNLYEHIIEKEAVYELVVSDVNNTKEVADYIGAEENGGAGKISVMGDSSVKEGLVGNNIAVVVKNIFAQLILMAQVVIGIFIVIALVVSSIMTSIVLYSSIVERKIEIGIIKAVGGRNKDVIRIFESEAILMGIFAGILGLVVAFILAPILEKVIAEVLNLNLPGLVTIPISTVPFTEINFPLATIISIILFSALVSFIAGYLPSKKATKMQVIDALRDE